ncbi:MAG: M20 family metallo-hydrolase, partial [Pseudomonadota bacterium]
ASTDPIGNLFLRHGPPSTDGALPVLSGSHLDSQPAGGWLDGVYGVVAALEAVQSLKEKGVALARPVEAVSWTNEEGSRFMPGVMGSSYYVERLAVADFADHRDPDGIRLGDALEALLASTPDLPVHQEPRPIAGLVEVHIEQGPILETEGKTIGVVEGVQGMRWMEVTIQGRTDHAGTTPLRQRRDAMLSATRIVQALNEALYDPDDVLRFTVGRFIAKPGSPNTVADEVVFTIDLRHPDDGVLERSLETIRRVTAEKAAPCEAVVHLHESLEPVRFDPAIVDTVAAATDDLCLPARRMVSGAGHDAAVLAQRHACGMIFVPCHQGISHHPAENADEANLIAGTAVLAETLRRLASN